MQHLRFERLDLSGLHTLVSWAKAEGWNPGPHDAAAFWATDPDGFFGCYKDDELIGGGSIVSYNGQFGFMGFFILKPEYRSAGIGKQLWYKRRDTLLSRLQKGASIGMDGVVAMQPFYQKGGFEIAFKDERYERMGEAFTINNNISPITGNDLSAILAYDEQCFGFPRPQFMKVWLHLPESQAFKYMEGDTLKGFVVVRKIEEGYKIAPLFADDEQVAEALYQAALNAVVGKPVCIDIPMVNEAAVRLVKKYNAQYIFECARMYYGTPPPLPTDKIFGITSFELG